MVRLEKVGLAQKSWWSAKNSPDLPKDRDLDQFKTVHQTCQVCKKNSKLIYNLGWTCLDTQCKAFFEFGTKYEDKNLDYNEAFMKERTRYLGPTPGPLAPPLLTDQDLANMDGFGVEKECKMGIVCPKCKGCSRRIEWRQWSCENLSCDFTHRISQAPIPIDEVVARSMTAIIDDEKDLMKGGIRFGQKQMGQYDVFEYTIPGLQGEDIGFVRHFRANGIINQQLDGPNDLFHQMQERDFGLKRNPARQGGGESTSF
jgi:hypothetical protein